MLLLELNQILTPQRMQAVVYGMILSGVCVDLVTEPSHHVDKGQER